MSVPYKVSVYQGLGERCNVAHNIAIIQKTAQDAASLRSNLIVYPELFLTSYDIGHENIRKLAEPQNGPSLKKISEIAKKNHIAIAISYAERFNDKIHNSVALFDSDGSLILNYRKCHLWSNYEKDVFTPGMAEDMKVVTLDQRFKVGILVCFDIEFPEPARVLALKGADILIVPTALGVGPVDFLTPRNFIPTRAQENHVLIVYSNFPFKQIGERGEKYHLEFCGQSAIVGPDGIDLQRASAIDNDIVLTAEFIPTKYEANYARNPYLEERRPELYQLLTSKLEYSL